MSRRNTLYRTTQRPCIVNLVSKLAPKWKLSCLPMDMVRLIDCPRRTPSIVNLACHLGYLLVEPSVSERGRRDNPISRSRLLAPSGSRAQPVLIVAGDESVRSTQRHRRSSSTHSLVFVRHEDCINTPPLGATLVCDKCLCEEVHVLFAVQGRVYGIRW